MTKIKVILSPVHLRSLKLAKYAKNMPGLAPECSISDSGNNRPTRSVIQSRQQSPLYSTVTGDVTAAVGGFSFTPRLLFLFSRTESWT
jgi:hypothetical protein